MLGFGGVDDRAGISGGDFFLGIRGAIEESRHTRFWAISLAQVATCTETTGPALIGPTQNALMASVEHFFSSTLLWCS